jgi:transposase
VSHANAVLTPAGRLRLARCVVDERWPLRHAAERFGVSVTTARLWAARYRQGGAAGMGDRSSRPVSCPHRLPTRTERRVLGLRVSRRWGPARIAYRLRLNPSTVHKVLVRYGAPPLRWTDPATRVRTKTSRPKARRYEHAQPGDLVHVEVKKLGRIPDGGGHKVLGPRGRRHRQGCGQARLRLPAPRPGRPLPAGLLRDPHRRAQGDRGPGTRTHQTGNPQTPRRRTCYEPVDSPNPDTQGSAPG